MPKSLGARVEVLGVRHHGPGSARSVGEALAELRPDVVLVEGAPELDAVVELLGHPDAVPPLAGLVHAADEPRRALFYPLASFSPEWVAVRWALAHGVPVAFADLPATHVLAPPGDDPETPTDLAPRPDPIGALAAAAGYDDPERWWEDAVEHRSTSSLERFAAVREAMAAVREADDRPEDDPDVRENARREAAMRRRVRQAVKDGHETIAFVCGAFHAPALDPATYPPVSHDTRLLAGLPKVKVQATWAPWTSGRLARASGYGAGVTSPGWYQHLFAHWSQEAPTHDVVSSWLVRVARTLREEQLDAAPATVVEAARLATALAAVRGRPSVGLTELDDAAQAVLCEGSDVPLRLVHDALVVGRELGSVPAGTPTVPLATDLARQQRRLRLKVQAQEQTVVLDLRREQGRERSVLLHRLRLLDVPWGEETETGRTSGTFKEAWVLEWRPELAVALVEAGLHGTTVASAAASRVAEEAERAPDLARLAELVGECLLADLPEALGRVVAVLEERTAHQHDVPTLLRAVEPLARTVRYGSVRDLDTSGLTEVLRAVVARGSVGLAAACSGLDDDAAARVREAVDAAERGIALLDREELRRPWREAAGRVARGEDVHGTVSGRLNRLLLDGGELDPEEAARRMSRRLSLAAPAPAGAAWLDGFLSGDGVLLVHDETLLGVVDAWVGGIAEEVFEDLLPLLRRTFSRFAATERRAVGEQVARLGAAPARPAAAPAYDLEQAEPAVRLVAELLGLPVEGEVAR